MRVVLGGTFGPIHDGHRALFRVACRRGSDGVVLGITTDEFARRTRERVVPPLETRLRCVVQELSTIHSYSRSITITAIDDTYAIAAEDPDIGGIVVSTETEGVVEKLNEYRRCNGMDPIEAIVVPVVTAEDGKRISSTRIVSGEVDQHGRLR